MVIRNITVWAVFAALCWAAAPAGADPGLSSVPMSSDVQGHLGIQTLRLNLAHHATEIDAFAKVLDPAPLVQADSDLRTAEAAAAASKAEADRARALNGNGMAAKDAEAAIAQARSDALKVDILHRQLGLAWTPSIARMSEAQRGRLIHGLSDGSIALVHVDTHNNEGQKGARYVKVDVGDDSVRGTVIGPARAAEPRLQSSGLIVEVAGSDAILLSVGLTQSAHIESSTPQTGFVLPRASIVRYQGSQWAYVRSGPTAFTRRLVQDPVPEADGFFVASGFSEGDEVVVQGAAALFAAEQSSASKGR